MNEQQVKYTKKLEEYQEKTSKVFKKYGNIEYEGKDKNVITGVDKKIVKLHNKGKYYGKCNHLA